MMTYSFQVNKTAFQSEYGLELGHKNTPAPRNAERERGNTGSTWAGQPRGQCGRGDSAAESAGQPRGQDRREGGTVEGLLEHFSRRIGAIYELGIDAASEEVCDGIDDGEE